MGSCSCYCLYFLIFQRTVSIWISTCSCVDFPIKNLIPSVSLSYYNKNYLEGIWYYLRENENIHYKTNKGEKVWFIKENLDILDEGIGETRRQKITSIDGSWMCFRWQVSWRDKLLALHSADRANWTVKWQH